MSAFFITFACINAALLAVCLRDRVPFGAACSAFGLAWCLANLAGWS